jgi:aminoglycoside phosphotransferase (APT) family kinase protein
LHGQSWNSAGVQADGVGLVMGTGTDVIWQDWFAELPGYFAAPRGYAAALSLHDPDRLRAAATTYRGLVQQQPRCLLHADAHIGNAYVERDGTVGFVDWQTTAVGHWAHDVNYFLVSALDFADRRAYEADLLEHYLKALASHDVDAPTSDEAQEQYRRSTVYGFLCWLCNPDIWQPAQVNAATFARFATAMLDHDTYAALGV